MDEREGWFALAQLRIAAAKERLDRTSHDSDAYVAESVQWANWSAAITLRRRRQSQPQ